MESNPEKHNRKSYRLKGYDYTLAGAYFITFCVKDRECVFGHVINGEMVLNELGKIAEENMEKIPNHFSNVRMGEFRIMPNHVHCILELREKGTGSARKDSGDLSNTTDSGTPHLATEPGRVKDGNSSGPKLNRFSQHIPGSVSVIIQQYKASVTKWCKKNKHNGFQWQGRFHDHIIRNAAEYYFIANYIIDNPAKWSKDKFYRK